jgi:hypothetical protein
MVGVRPKPVLQSVCGQLRRLRRSTLLLIILVAGFIDVALLGSFAMGPQLDRKVATASKLQQRLAAVASDTNFSRQRDAALAPPLVLRSEPPPQPDPANTPHSESLSGSDPQPVSVLDPSSALQTGASPQLNTVPLPTRKPETSTLKRPSTKKASLKRTIKRHVEDEPKPPMQFGNFGYDYVGQ